MALLVSGNVVRMSRGLGTPSPSNNYVTTKTTVVGNLSSSLPTTYTLRATNEGVILRLLGSAMNSIKLGNITPSKIYLGNGQVTKIYLGSTLVYRS